MILEMKTDDFNFEIKSNKFRSEDCREFISPIKP